MKRIILIVIRSFIHLPRLLYWLFRVAAHPERYTLEQRYKLIHRVAEITVDYGRVSLVCTGLENLPKENGYILYPNHQGLFDILALCYLHEKPISVVLKEELMKIPVVRQLSIVIGGIPLDREDPRQGMKVILEVTDRVKQGENFIVFAEGTRSREGNKLLDFKGGSFKSATKAGCPIIPVAILDSYQIMDTNSIKPMTVQIHFLDPITPEEYQGMKTVEIAKMVKERIEAKIGECEEEGAAAADDGVSQQNTQ